MNWSQPYPALRLAWERSVQIGAWWRTTALAAAVAASSLSAAAEEPPDFPDFAREASEAEMPEGRAKVILGNYPAVEAEDAEEDDPDLIWAKGGIIRVSAVQEAPVLVPLPDPPLPTAIPPAPLPSPTDVLRDPGAEGPPVAPLVPPEPGCPGCRPGASAMGGETGGYRIGAADDHFGMGSRQAPFATFHIDPVQPLSQIRLRADFASGLQSPDRAERFWAAPPVGPAQAERNVDYQTFSLYSEVAGDHFSAFTEVPLVSLQADVNGDTTGLGNIIVGQKFLLTNSKNRNWQIAQILRTYLPTGSAERGLGNDLTALEPGLLFRYRCSDQFYVHGELKYWIPLGGDPNFSGRVLQYGAGISTVLWQTDNRAIMPTLEFIGSTIGDGQATLPSGAIVPNNGDTFFSVLPGVRVAVGPSGDLGLFEIGASGGVTFGDPGWYDSRFLFDFRWSF